MTHAAPHLLAEIEPRLRSLLPADLYAAAWLDPSQDTLLRVFDHLRSLQHILYDYIPRQVVETLPSPGDINFRWQSGTLMFTDLAGFTHLLETNAAFGREGAHVLLDVLNRYFAKMIEIVSKSGGTLLEFTGDAMLVKFVDDPRRNETAQAVRAGLRMQRAMAAYDSFDTEYGTFSLGMRIGVHTGPFLTANVGTPRRMDHVLLGNTVRNTKRTEDAGVTGRVNLTEQAYEEVRDRYRFEAGKPGYMLVVDDLADDQLGEVDFTSTRRLSSAVLLDRSLNGLVTEIANVTGVVELLASYLPLPILNVVVESTAHRSIAPRFPQIAVMFVNLIGLTEGINQAAPADEAGLIAAFSRVFTLINAAVEARGGVLKKTTYHLDGSDIMIYFGVPHGHADDALRAAEAALAIRRMIMEMPPLTIGGEQMTVASKIGLSFGSAFAGEVGEPRGRREYNVLGDTVNMAARLMSYAGKNEVLMTGPFQEQVADYLTSEFLGEVTLKGKAEPQPVYRLCENEAADDH